jgi:hypothetical protein
LLIRAYRKSYVCAHFLLRHFNGRVQHDQSLSCFTDESVSTLIRD